MVEPARPSRCSRAAQAYTRQAARRAAAPRRRHRAAAGGEPLMSVRGLKVDFAGRRLFRPRRQAARLTASTSIFAPGETVAVVGGSGSGKTTLGRAMLRLIRPSGGEIRFRGKPCRTAADRDYRLLCQTGVPGSVLLARSAHARRRDRRRAAAAWCRA
jgi:peptide/nickel transport system ATP-binding protein